MRPATPSRRRARSIATLLFHESQADPIKTQRLAKQQNKAERKKLLAQSWREA
jgi:hypothetical protein